MNALSKNDSRQKFVRIVLRAICSTVAIAAFVSGVVIVHRGRFQVEEIKSVWSEYWELLAIIFFALVIWDYWLQRTAYSRRS
jgi:hypothetical protein